MSISRILTALFIASAFHLFSVSAWSQGSLTPPGPPAPTMQTLDQLGAKIDQANTTIGSANSGITTANSKLDALGAKTEKRTPISSAPFAINTSGSYYLARNLSVKTGDAITITASGVTLDLNGFTITSTAASATGTAILLSDGSSNIAIEHGAISGGFANGISQTGSFTTSIHVSHVFVDGTLASGIALLTGGVVESCTARNVAGIGLQARVVKNSAAYNCASGISAVSVLDCYCIATGDPAIQASTASNTYGFSPNGTGISTEIATNCVGNGGTGDGISANVALNCSGGSRDGNGINAIAATNCYGASDSGVGVRCVKGKGNTGIATGCYGESFSGVGINAGIANSCIGIGPTPVSAAYKYNMP